MGRHLWLKCCPWLLATFFPNLDGRRPWWVLCVLASFRFEDRGADDVALCAGFYDVTMQTLEVSASAHFDFGSSVSSFGESGCGSRTSLDVVHVLAFGVDFVP